MTSCPECGGIIPLEPTIDGTSEYVCKSCACVIDQIVFQEFLTTQRPPGLSKKRKYQPTSKQDLLDRVDPTWRYIIPRFRKDTDPKKYGYANPILASLFRNPFVGVRIYKDRVRPSRSFRHNIESSYIDMRRKKKYTFESRIRRLTEKAFSRFDQIAQKSAKRRRGLFAACLYVEALIQCLEDIQFFLSPIEVIKEKTADGNTKNVFYISKKQKHIIRRRLCAPKPLKNWFLCFHVSRKTIMRRIEEIDQETPHITEMVAFVRFFLV